MTRLCSNCCSLSCGFNKRVFVASRKTLLTKKYYVLLWGVWYELKLSRRKTAFKVVEVICRNCCTQIFSAAGEIYDLPEFDDVFPDDIDFTWFGTYLQADETGMQPKILSTKVERLEYLDIAAKLIKPSAFEL